MFCDRTAKVPCRTGQQLCLNKGSRSLLAWSFARSAAVRAFGICLVKWVSTLSGMFENSNERLDYDDKLFFYKEREGRLCAAIRAGSTFLSEYKRGEHGLVRRRTLFCLGSHPPAPFRHVFMSAEEVLWPEGGELYINIHKGLRPLKPAFRKRYIVSLSVVPLNLLVSSIVLIRCRSRFKYKRLLFNGEKATFMPISIESSFYSSCDNSHKSVPAERTMFIKHSMT